MKESLVGKLALAVPALCEAYMGLGMLGLVPGWANTGTWVANVFGIAFLAGGFATFWTMVRAAVPLFKTRREGQEQRAKYDKRNDAMWCLQVIAFAFGALSLLAGLPRVAGFWDSFGKCQWNCFGAVWLLLGLFSHLNWKQRQAFRRQTEALLGEGQRGEYNKGNDLFWILQFAATALGLGFLLVGLTTASGCRESFRQYGRIYGGVFWLFLGLFSRLNWKQHQSLQQTLELARKCWQQTRPMPLARNAEVKA